MLKRISAFFSAIILLFSSAFPGLFGNHGNIQPSSDSDIRPDTWALTDGLGRRAPLAGEVKENDKEKFVGLFYWTWHTNFGQPLAAKNATEILAEHPEIQYDFDSPLWEPEASYPNGRPFFWDQPIWGYYLDTDEYVLRKNAELIADAGVDVIIFDCTNGTATWDESCEKLFEVFKRAKEDGVNVPKIAYILPFDAGDDATTSLKHLYNDIYSKESYKDLWFMWDGKPLIMAHSSQLDKNNETEAAILDFFTFRQNEPAYFVKDTLYFQKIWGWCSDYPQSKYGKSLNGDVEEMCVSVAQNAASGELVAMSADRDDVQGRDFAKNGYSYSYNYAGKKITCTSDMENAYLYGLNFQQQWDYAIKCDPQFVFVTGWNEWIAGRWDVWQNTLNAFPDQFSPRFSRDCEPSDGVLKDYYYCQLCENIRRFKGVSNTVEAVDGVKTYCHYTGSTPKRDSAGWKGLYYTNDTMRNDFVKAEVSDNGKYITMKIYTKDNITPYTDRAWMRVFVDIDPTDRVWNWEGFEYVINRENATANTVKIEKSLGGWTFREVGTATYTVESNVMTLTIPVAAFGLSADNVHFNFKLSDNMQQDGDIMDFYKNGDVAPGGRFTFVY